MKKTKLSILIFLLVLILFLFSLPKEAKAIVREITLSITSIQIPDRANGMAYCKCPTGSYPLCGGQSPICYWYLQTSEFRLYGSYIELIVVNPSGVIKARKSLGSLRFTSPPVTIAYPYSGDENVYIRVRGYSSTGSLPDAKCNLVTVTPPAGFYNCYITVDYYDYLNSKWISAGCGCDYNGESGDPRCREAIKFSNKIYLGTVPGNSSYCGDFDFLVFRSI